MGRKGNVGEALREHVFATGPWMPPAAQQLSTELSTETAMSNRTLIEFNHDYAGDLGEEFLRRLGCYLRSASRETARDLEPFGVRVVGMRHHSSNYIMDGTPDGFPPQYLTRAKA